MSSIPGDEESYLNIISSSITIELSEKNFGLIDLVLKDQFVLLGRVFRTF